MASDNFFTKQGTESLRLGFPWRLKPCSNSCFRHRRARRPSNAKRPTAVANFHHAILLTSSFQVTLPRTLSLTPEVNTWAFVESVGVWRSKTISNASALHRWFHLFCQASYLSLLSNNEDRRPLCSARIKMQLPNSAKRPPLMMWANICYSGKPFRKVASARFMGCQYSPTEYTPSVIYFLVCIQTEASVHHRDSLVILSNFHSNGLDVRPWVNCCGHRCNWGGRERRTGTLRCSRNGWSQMRLGVIWRSTINVLLFGLNSKLSWYSPEHQGSSQTYHNVQPFRPGNKEALGDISNWDTAHWAKVLLGFMVHMVPWIDLIRGSRPGREPQYSRWLLSGVSFQLWLFCLSAPSRS